MLYGWSAWRGHLKNWERLVEEVSDSGFGYVELSLDFPLPYKAEEVREAVKRLREKNLKVSIHAPWRGVDLATPWESIRKGALELMELTASIAHSIEAEYVVLHMTTPEKLDQDVRDKVIESAIKSAKRIVEISEEYSVPMYIENVGKLGHPDTFGKIMDESGAEFCLDLAHAIVDFARRHKVELDRVDVDDVMNMWISSLKNNIKCVHVHGVVNEDGKIRSHQALGYPLTKRVVAKTIAQASPEYVTLEIYYNKGKEVGPRFVAREVEEINSWLRVYRKSK
ncbi:hypothetical protein IPA_00515 [Ignicoccus pacificus DSM 13166]|uniref:Xylose isomerase-like TIM barrel domain-containing protein n=1 Tax=Ignicoccus pacificus DSM 13166 TaxID=940294 RepID=A0A977KBT4_9CREN|nr:hypothetical protein IPA_00515 [Ignicoccus pacificus DSM 13166]